MTRPSFKASLLFAALTLVLTACGGEGGPDSAKADAAAKTEIEARVPVEVATAKRSPLTQSFQGTATLQAVATSEVVSKTTGVVLQLMVEEGDAVRKGDLLARLESDRQRLSVRQAKADLAKQESEFKRTEQMFERKLIANDAFDRARYDLEMQRAMLAMQELELSYTEIRAPITGVVSERMVRAGNLIQQNQPLFRIDDFDPLEAVINVPEREMQVIAAGQPVSMLVDAVPGEVFQGTVARVSPVVDANSGTFRVVAHFRDQAGRLRSGMFGRLSVVHDVREEVLTVPRQALLAEDQDAAVFRIDEDGVARRQPVTLGYVSGGVAEVRTGLEQGAMVVTLGQAGVREGTKVQVLNPPAEVPGGAAQTAQLASTPEQGG